MFNRIDRENSPRNIRHWMIGCFLLVILILMISYMVMVRSLGRINFEESRNQLRLTLNLHQQEVMVGNYTVNEYPYAVLSKEGKILFNNTEIPYRAGEKVLIQEFMDEDVDFHQRYPEDRKEAFVLENQDGYQGTVMYLIPKSYYAVSQVRRLLLDCTKPMAAGCLAVILFLGFCIHQCFKKMLRPIEEISKSSKEIIKGNYDMEVVRIYDTEVAENELGDLIFSFELMRDELKARQVREEALKHSQQELISCISHDLRTPISTIKAYTEGLRDGIADTKQKENMFLGIILGKVNLLSGMIEELLEYSNTQLNQLTINQEEIFFQSFWTRITKELEVYVKQQDAELTFNDPGADALVRMDTNRILEVINNLIENSVKYRGSQPLKIQLSAEIEDQQILIRVIDNGIGIGPSDTERIFDKFYRAEKSRTSAIPGSGLGLSICKYIIEQHGGEIYCKSQSGCEIGFTVPIL